MATSELRNMVDADHDADLSAVFVVEPSHDKAMTGYFKVFYDDLLGPRREQIRSVLEIGVREGASMLIWRSGFPHAAIVGVDISPRPGCMIDMENSEFFQMDAYTDEAVATLSARQPKGYDLIIDDGPHTFDSQRIFLQRYAPMLSQDGILVVEDIMDVGNVVHLMSHVDRTAFAARSLIVPPEMMQYPFRSQFKDGLGIIICERWAAAT